ncbi:hypothetical protein Glove_117g463 [Diversispora epigaea]|uniref:Uncharacterized protein n=1 Tax=Diversispora epigaea TaxID=1348612 RepID=A0A397J2V1_9GLOM|nr:hypothetical protein Glove_117g463 [Diversispora epigaea]
MTNWVEVCLGSELCCSANQSDLKKGITKYVRKHTVTLIPGTRIDKETTYAEKTIFKAANVPIECEQLDLSGFAWGVSSVVAQTNLILKKHTVTLIPGTRIDKETTYAEKTIFKAANVPIECEQLDLSDVDFAIIHENTEGELLWFRVSGIIEDFKDFLEKGGNVMD